MRQHNQCSQLRHFSSSSPLSLSGWTKTSVKLKKAILSTDLLFSHKVNAGYLITLQLWSYALISWSLEMQTWVSGERFYFYSQVLANLCNVASSYRFFFCLGVPITQVKKRQQQSEPKEWSGHLGCSQKVIYDCAKLMCRSLLPIKAKRVKHWKLFASYFYSV